MRSFLFATALFATALLVACGGDPPPASTPSPSPSPAPVEPPPPPAPDPEPTRPASELRTIEGPLVYTTDAGGIVRHGEVLVRYGDGDPAVLGPAERARCTVSIEERHTVLPAGTWGRLTVRSTPRSPEHAAFCARFDGMFTRGHASDPRAGGPAPPPSFPGSDCFLRPQIVSITGAACASLEPHGDVGGSPSRYDVRVFGGNCCVGPALRTVEVPGTAQAFLLADDGSTFVARVRDAFVQSSEVSSNPVMFVAATEAGARELRVAELLAGDPILSQGVGFAVQARLEGTALVVSTAGGPPHRHPLR